jgi:hypothetical protein
MARAMAEGVQSTFICTIASTYTGLPSQLNVIISRKSIILLGFFSLA